MKIKLISFGFHYGIPENLDATIDARIITNPYRNRKLRSLTGLHKDVQADVLSHKALSKRLFDQIDAAIKSAHEKKEENVTIGIGCSFGHHRSVALVEAYKDLYTRDSQFMKMQYEQRKPGQKVVFISHYLVASRKRQLVTRPLLPVL